MGRQKCGSMQKAGMQEVRDITELAAVSDTQIVIAVMSKKMADEIRKELKQMGISEERVAWIETYTYPVAYAEWKSEKIG